MESPVNLPLRSLRGTLSGIGAGDAHGRELLSTLAINVPDGELLRAAEHATSIVRRSSSANFLRGAIALAELVAPFHRAEGFALLEEVRLMTQRRGKDTICDLAQLLLAHNYHLEPVNEKNPPVIVFDAHLTAHVIEFSLRNLASGIESYFVSANAYPAAPRLAETVAQRGFDRDMIAVYAPVLLSLRNGSDSERVQQTFSFWRLNGVLAESGNALPELSMQAQREYELAYNRAKAAHDATGLSIQRNIALGNASDFAQTLHTGCIHYANECVKRGWHDAAEAAFWSLRLDLTDKPWIRRYVPLEQQADAVVIRLTNLCFQARTKFAAHRELPHDIDDLDWRRAFTFARHAAYSISEALRAAVQFREGPIEKTMRSAVQTLKFDFPEVFAAMPDYLPKNP